VATLQHPEASEFEVDEGVRIHRIQTAWSRHLGRFYQNPERPFHPTAPDPGVMRALRQIVEAEQPDVVHARGWIIYSYLAVARRLRVPLVVTLHDYGLVCPKKTFLHKGSVCSGPQWLKCVDCAAEPYGTAKSLAITSGLQVSSRLHSRVDRFVAISDAVARASGSGTRGRPLTVIPTFIPDDVVAAGRGVERPSFLPEEDGYLLFVGGLVPTKGADVLLRAYERLEDPPELVLIGSSYGSAGTDYPEGVTVACDVPHAQVMAAWQRCSIGLVPSVWPEPFGQVAVEAMASGRPVVASDTGGLSDVVVDGETGLLVPPGDEAELAAAIERLLADPAERDRMGRAARARATGFMVSSVADRIEDLYRGLTPA
jgi:glycosyltransferase involved in cell wall biosynthesis